MKTALSEIQSACGESDNSIGRASMALQELDTQVTAQLGRSRQPQLHPVPSPRIPSPRPPLHWAIALACFGIGAIVGAAAMMAAMAWGVGG
jgi:hypothetical protein